MKLVNGIWLPDHEQHLLQFAKKIHEDGKWRYQSNKLAESLKYLKNNRVAVDVGGHCGLWSMHLVKMFDFVHAFEPIQEHRDCYVKNVEGKHELHPVALGEKPGFVAIKTSFGSSGDSQISGEGDLEMKTLDSFGLDNVDFIKLDCEGYEYFALKGGEETIKRNKPLIVVEQKPGRGQAFGLKQTQAVTYLEGLGAKLRKEISGDYILSWD